MKSVRRLDLVNALGVLSDFVSTSPKPSMAERACVLFTPKSGSVVLSACDVDAAEVEIDAEIDNFEAFVLPFGKLAAIAKEATSDQVEFVAGEKGKFDIRCGYSRFSVQSGGDKAVFVSVARPAPDRKRKKLTGQSLASLLNSTMSAVDKSSVRVALSGIALDFSDKLATATATDGRRLLRAFAPADGELVTSVSVVLPKASAVRLVNAFGHQAECVLTVIEGNLICQSGRTWASFRLIDGRFPNCEEMLSTNGMEQVQANAGELCAAIRQAGVMNDKESVGINLRLTGDRMALKVVTAEKGQADVWLPIESTVPGEVEIELNGRYMLDAIGQIDPAIGVTFAFKSKNERAVFCSGKGDFSAVIMPMA